LGGFGEQELQMQAIINSWYMLHQSRKEFAPYLMVEILLPGGTLFALLLFLYQRGKLSSGGLRDAWRSLTDRLNSFALWEPIQNAPVSTSDAMKTFRGELRAPNIRIERSSI
jgi:hypothetical protein